MNVGDVYHVDDWFWFGNKLFPGSKHGTAEFTDAKCLTGNLKI